MFAEDNDRAFATGPATSQIFVEILFYDYCLREKPKSRPCFVTNSQMDKQALKEVYLSFGVKREEEGMHDIEWFSFEANRNNFVNSGF